MTVMPVLMKTFTVVTPKLDECLQQIPEKTSAQCNKVLWNCKVTAKNPKAPMPPVGDPSGR